MTLFLTVLAVFVLVVGCELWWRKSTVDEEFSRKFLHITIGSFVAFWPFFLSWNQIKILSVAFLLVVAVSKYAGFFEAIHSVQRPTWGELFFAAAVGIVALISENKWIYAASLLQMSLADGLAAVIGSRFGGKHRYLVLNHTKSAMGTLTFFIVSLATLIVFNQWLPTHLNVAQLVGISALASIIENLGVRGFDNLLVPVLAALLLVNA